MSPPDSASIAGARARPARSSLHAAIAGALLALALLASGRALFDLAAHRVPLSIHWGAWLWIFALLAGIALALELLAAARLVHDWRANSQPAARLFELRTAFAVLTATLVCVLLLGQPARGLECEVALGLAGGAYAFAVLAEPRLRSRAPRIVRAAELIAFNLCVAVLVAEVGLRLKDRWRPSRLLARADAGAQALLATFHLSPGAMRFGFPTNSSGHYDDEFTGKRAGEFLVLNVGDSFSVGIGPHGLHYTTVCEKELGQTAVYNLGAPAIGPAEYLELLRTEGLPFSPDAIVIGLFVGNDVVFYDSRAERVERGLAPWFDRGRYLTPLFVERLFRLWRAHTGGGDAQKNVGDVLDPAAETGGRIEDLEELCRAYPWLRDPALEQPTFSEEIFRGLEAARVAQTCDPAAAPFTALREVLLEMQSAARDVPLLVMLIPDEFQVEDEVWNEALAAMPRGEFERTLPQQSLLPWLAEHGMTGVDLLPAMLAVPPGADGRRHLYHLRNTHFNSRGNEVAGKALAEALRPFKERVLARERAAAQSK